MGAHRNWADNGFLLQYALTFKKLGYAVTDGVDKYGEFLLIRCIGSLKGCLALFIFCIDSIKEQHMEVDV